MSDPGTRGFRLRRAWWRIRAALALLPIIVALDLPFTASPLLLLGSVLLVLASVTAFASVMLRPAPGESVVPDRRKRITLVVAATSLSLVLGLVVLALLPARASREFGQVRFVAGRPMMAQGQDAELGWAPQVPPGVVGQRLDVVDPHRRRILFIGDSIVFGLHLQAEQTAVRLIESRLPGWQVLNGSVSGYSIDQYAIYLRRVIAEARPELVVIGVFTGNDFQITGREFSWGTSKPLFALDGDRLVRANRGAACIERLNRSFLVRLLWQNRALAQTGIETICRPRLLQPHEQERVVARLFDDIDDTARRAGVPVLWTLLPVGFEYSAHSPVRFLYTTRHRTLLRLLGERPREVVDFAIDVAQQPDIAGLYFEDNAHLRPGGQRLLADVLYHAITTRYPFVH